MRKPMVLVIGTRAEAIKLIPLYLALLNANIPALLCATFQHAELLEQVCDIFNVIPDFNLKVMKKNQDLFYLTQTILEKTKQIYLQTNPCLVIVHGDTTTTMASALAAFYLHIPVAHVEAGLRTGNMLSPFPEEMNRKVVGQIGSYHFAPTAFSTANLLAEGINRNQIFCTGNTIVDAITMIKEKIETNQIEIDMILKKQINVCKKNGQTIGIFRSMKQFAQTHRDVAIFFPVHPNPNVKQAVELAKMDDEPNIVLLEPLKYKDLVYLLMKSDWVASDSGGIQEEAVSLGKRILVLRDITERWEGVWEGAEVLVGTNEKLILQEMEKIYRMNNKTIRPSSIYGDGNACKRIVTILENHEKNLDTRSGLHRTTNRASRSKAQF